MSTSPTLLLMSLCAVRRLRAAIGLALAVLLGCGGAAAQGTAGDAAAIVTEGQAWLDQALANTGAIKTPGNATLRMEVSVGSLDARLRLAPCASVEPYMPAGMRLWGRTRLGLRCVDGMTRWNVFLPVHVKAFGKAWVLQRDVAAGATLSQEDALLEEVDWAQERDSIMADPADWIGQTSARALTTGQALRHTMVRPTQVFQAGAQVRVQARGPGFTISSAGQALSPGIVGQQARVRIDNGRILSGVVLDTRTVQVEL